MSTASMPPEIHPRVDHIITEDDTPVASMYSEKQRRLLTEPLYSSWKPGIPFVAAANVGVFFAVREWHVVPDVFVSLEVEVHKDLHAKEHRGYFVWEFGKVPDVAVEIVSDTEGGKTGDQMRKCARMGVQYYVTYDPTLRAQPEAVRGFALRDKAYQPYPAQWLPLIGLGLTLWSGQFEGVEENWLRWCDREGQLIPTGAERAEQEHRRAERERQRADEAFHRAEQERQRADRLALNRF